MIRICEISFYGLCSFGSLGEDLVLVPHTYHKMTNFG